MASGTIGVIVPVYNTDGSYIDECIASVLAQSAPCALVVVDDGSTNPSTLASLNRWSEQGVTVVRHPENRGTSAASPGIASAAGSRSPSNVCAAFQPPRAWLTRTPRIGGRRTPRYTLRRRSQSRT